MNEVMNKSKRFYSALIFILSMLFFCCASFGQSTKLTINVADASAPGGWIDAGSISNANNWSLQLATKQIQVVAEFPYGAQLARQVEINIPAGYNVLEMSAMPGWMAPTGIVPLALSSEDAPKVASTSIMAIGGVTSWASQLIPIGPIPPTSNYYSSNTGSPKNIKGGKITYTFNNNCDHIILTVTLTLEQAILPHANATNTLLPIIAKSTYGDALPTILTETLTTTVKDVVAASLSGTRATPVSGGSRVVPGVEDSPGSNTGTIPMFTTGQAYSVYNSSMANVQSHWIDSGTYEVTYPAGVKFEGFRERMVLGHTNGGLTPAVAVSEFAPTGGLDIYETTVGDQKGHLKVTSDTLNRKVTFQYTNVFGSHDSGVGSFWCYWTAVIDGINIQWEKTMSFPATWTETAGALVGNSQAMAAPYGLAVNITPRKQEHFNVKAVAVNRTRRDLNAYAGGTYQYDQYLGSFQIRNEAPNDLETPLKYVFTFDDSLQVRALTLPGYTGNDFSDLYITTNLQSHVKVGTTFNATNQDVYEAGYMFDSAALGLASGEFLRNFEIVQSGLVAIPFSNTYTRSATNYFGRWQGGVEGNVTVAIYDYSNPGVSDVTPYSTATSHTNIVDWDKDGVAGAGTVTLAMNNRNGVLNTTGSFYPTDRINFNSTYSTYTSIASAAIHTGDAVDPFIYICLPEGIDLDTSTIQGRSRSGNYGYTDGANSDGWFDLLLFGTDTYTDTIGVNWNVYVYTSVNDLDMVAQHATSNFSSVLIPTGYSSLQVRFSADVNSTCPTYTSIEATDMVFWDLGRTAISLNSPTHTVNDVRNITGKGTSYVVVAPRRDIPLNIVQQPSFDVYLGIRVSGESAPFYTYNGTDASVAPVSVDAPAELWVKYANTSATPYAAGSEIYLPIPKSGYSYDKFFNNKVIVEPFNNEGSPVTPQWSAYLSVPVSSDPYYPDAVALDNFTTYYLIDAIYTTNPATIDNSWAPIIPTTSWKTAAQMTSGDWANVTMIKFVSYSSLVAGANDEATFLLNVDPAALLGQTNYWRSYQKGWRVDNEGSANGEGTWQYGSVVAAEASKAGISGMLFKDVSTRNGLKDLTGENFDNSAPDTGITARLTGSTITPLNIKMNADGSFASVDENGVQYFLKTGDYTVTFTNNSGGAYFFTSVTPGTHSDGTNWYMDIPQGAANISVNGTTGRHNSATYTFKVQIGDSTSTEYVGVGLLAADYTLTYNLNAGDATWGDTSSPIEANVPYGTTVEDTASYVANISATGKPIRTGYTFVGWYTESAGTNNAASVTITGNTGVYAKWTANTYAVTYDKNATDAAESAITTPFMSDPHTATYGQLFTLRTNTFTRPGYTFTGWNTAADGSGTAYAPGYTFTPSWNLLSGLALFAQWEVNNYTVNYDVNGATSGAILAKTGVKWSDTDLLPTPAPTRTGYTLVGWTVTVGGGEGTSVSSSSTYSSLASSESTTAITLQAQWRAKEYTVNYAGDSISISPKTGVNWDDSDLLPTPPTRPSYIFNGWNVTVGGKVPAATNVQSSDKYSDLALNDATMAITLTAQWTASDFTLRFDNNSTAAANGSITSKTVTGGIAVGTLPGIGTGAPTRTGYTFSGWSTDSGTGNTANFTAISIINADTTVYAVWTAKEYVISYGANGGSGSMGNDTATYNKNFTLSENVFTRDGYTFIGWNTESDGTGTSYDDEHEFTPWTTDGGLNLYAQWRAIDIDIIYIFAGNTKYADDIVSYDSVIESAPTDPIRAGYTFNGWFSGTDGNGIEWAFGLIGGTPVNVENGVDLLNTKLPLYAYWIKRIVNSVAISGSYANVSGANTYEADTLVTIDAGTRSGYTFIGWTPSDDSIQLADPTSATTTFAMPGKNVSLVANWQSNGGTTVGTPNTPSNPTPPVRTR